MIVTQQEDETARTVRNIEYGEIAGYAYNGEAYCVDCAREAGLCYSFHDPKDLSGEEPRGFNVGVISTNEKWDTPGAYCGVCLESLQTRLVHYE